MALYDYESDLRLFKPLDYKPLDSVNFDKFNQKIDENDNLFNKTKSLIAGTIEGTATGGSNTFNIVLEKLGQGANKFFKELTGIDNFNILPYAGIFLLFVLLNRK